MLQDHTFNTFVTNELNAAQQKAVLQGNGPTLVIAGAGSGKTRVITARITNLILNHHVSPSAIVALTFTNKAANEMKSRIASFLDDQHILPFVGTFHSYCVRLLKQNSRHFDIPTFTILDGDDQMKIITGILQRLNAPKHVTPRNVLYQISHIKNQLIDAVPISSLFNHPLVEQIYYAYEKEKTASKCFDFDDLMLKVLQLFKKDSTFKNLHQNRVRHLLVDEYQDTNKVQHELLKQMTLQQTTLEQATVPERLFSIDSLCAVGDEDQSIYSWRGATIENMIHFKNDFNDTQIIKIEQNYRSVQPILELANRVIEQNKKRNSKKLWSNKNGVDRIRAITCMSEYQEGEAIAYCLKAAAKKQKRSNMAVLYRTHAQSRAIEEALIKNSIPYQIIGGMQFYERKEIKDLLAYFRLIINPFDRPSFFRVINTPSRGLGLKTEELLYDYWQNEPFLDFKDICQAQQNQVPASKQKTLQSFVAVFDNLDATTTPSKAITTIITKTEYMQYLRNTYDPQEAEERIENVQELVEAIRYFEENMISSIESLLHEIALMQEKVTKQDKQHDKVLLMSLHAAKGLEFDLVILAGLEEGIIPSSRSLNHADTVEEERRLFYVGITRAKEHLLLTHAKYRYTYGKMVDQIPSQFLQEIPKNLITRQDVSSGNNIQFISFFADWFGNMNGDSQTSQVFTFSKPTSRLTPTQITASTTSSSSHHYMPDKLPFSDEERDIQKEKIMVAKKNQPVKHETYGLGIVEKSEKKADKTYVTVKFKAGTKKIISDFLEYI